MGMHSHPESHNYLLSKMLTFSIPKFSMQVVALCMVVFSLLETPSFALRKSYIVYLGAHSHGPEVTTAQLDAVRDSHHEFLGSFLGSKEKAREAIFYSYKRHINGFAATLDEEDVAEIKNHPNVVSVFENKRRELYTTHSWEFLMLEQNGVILSNSLWKKAGFGEDIIIANLDGGVWPESKSFSDEGYGPIPSKWKGQCHHKAGIPCNRKLIGARLFNRAFLADGGKISASMNNARDYDGHGSHTLSTAGGNFVAGAQVFGALNGTAKGGAPRARLASYKVCWNDDCYDADIMKAFDVAIHDRVDVLSISLGAPSSNYFDDAMSIGTFHAVKEGIAVVCAAGNEGPLPTSVTNVSPWIFTVGASTLDRSYATFVLLQNGKRLQGSSITKALPEDKFYPLITAARAKASNATIKDASHCLPGTLDPVKVKGKIMVCIRGGQISRKETGRQALLAGAVGMILCNDGGNLTYVRSDDHVLPAAHLNYTDGLAVFDYINSTSDPVGFITPSVAQYGRNRAPVLAPFSSRGPNIITPEILKPDITAPGVGIISAFSEAISPDEDDNRRTPYAILTGTSMACPHVAGVVALLKSLHPRWSSAAIRSAIMTTATTRDNRMSPMADGFSSNDDVKATPFGYGAGHIRPNRAADPGLVYDLTIDDYLDFLCAFGYNKTMIRQFSKDPYKCPHNAEVKARGTNSSSLLLNFNYPSITVPNIKAGSSVTVTRRLKSVGGPGKYHVRLRQPQGFLVSVEPRSLTFNGNAEVKTFQLTVKAKNDNKSPHPAAKGYSYGELIWSDGNHYVRSPTVVSRA